MKPNPELSLPGVDRRSFLRRSLLGMGLSAAAGWAVLPGCATPLFRGQSPDEALPEEEKKLELVGDYTRPWGLNYVKLESVALATNLDNTGSDPPPSPQRDQLINEMQSHEIRTPDKILALPSNSLVLVRGYLPPGCQKGDHFDVEVRVPSRGETTSLRGGWLMQSRLRQMEVLGGRIHTGNVDGLAQGDLLVDAVFAGSEDKVLETRSRVLGGGVSLTSRPLGLAIRREDASVRISLLIAASINSRFFSFDRGVKKGVAEPQRDNFMELVVSPRYKHNLGRYLRVIRNIALKENAVARVERLQVLERRLLEPTTSALAALQLEAIGKESISSLKSGLQAKDREVRFYAAEALAYLDDADAAPVLGEVARAESAFRWHALAALTAMDHVAALEALTNLLHEKSAETRYGAFQAIRTRNPNDPGTKGEVVDKKFRYHLIPTTGEPLVHFARSKRPEVVLFGHEQRIKPPAFIQISRGLTMKGVEGNQIKVSRFRPGDENDSFETCSTELDQVIRTIVKLGGGYADVIQAIQELKKENCLEARVAVEALPKPGRAFIRDENEPTPPDEEEDESEESKVPTEFAGHAVGTPAPELFNDQLNHSTPTEKKEKLQIDTFVAPGYEQQPEKSIFGKLNPFQGE
jgi:flagellar basal body P-ring protein FlgI